jgi:hypothetical protein
MEDVTIVIQGKIDYESLLSLSRSYSDWKVVLSTWTNEDFEGIIFPENWTILKFPKPSDNLGYGNLYFQVQSTLNGLRYVETPYCIKLRGDEFYSNLDHMVNELKLNPSRIYCTSIFFRALHPNTSFHISDHLLVGTTENIKLMIENTKYLMESAFWFPEGRGERHTPEPYLGFGFIQKKENISLENVESLINSTKSNQLMSLKWFGVYPLELLDPYIVSVKGNQFKSRCDCQDNLR